MSALQLAAASLVWLGRLGFYVWTLLRALAQARRERATAGTVRAAVLFEVQ